jgi:RNA polymerase sigma-B factor
LSEIEAQPPDVELPDRRRRDERWLRLVRRYHDGDRSAREQLVAEMLPLVNQLARRYAGRASHDDLVGAGLLGLTKAIDRFDVRHASELSAYAVPSMLGEMRRYMRDHNWSVRPPRRLQEDSLRVTRALAELEARLAHSPTARQIAEHLDLPLEVVVEALTATRAYTSASLQQPVGDGELTLGDTLGADDVELERSEIAATVGQLAQTLTDRERELLYLRFARDLTQTEVARRMGVSQMQISRLLRATVTKLRDEAARAAPSATSQPVR